MLFVLTDILHNNKYTNKYYYKYVNSVYGIDQNLPKVMLQRLPSFCEYFELLCT